MSDESKDQLEKLNRYHINPEEDFGYAVYEELFEKEIKDLEDYTGFDIQW